jgi:hypothetical protein
MVAKVWWGRVAIWMVLSLLGGCAGDGGREGPVGVAVAAVAMWQATGPAVAPRISFSGTLLPTGDVLLAGGSLLSKEVIATAEIYDVRSNRFRAGGAMTTPRLNHSATLLQSGKVLLAGGSPDFLTTTKTATAEFYDPQSGTSIPTGSMATARAAHTATPLPNGEVLIAGGFGNGTSPPSCEIYDPVTGSFKDTGDLLETRGHHTATLLSDGRVLLVGGVSQGKVRSTAEIYDPATGELSFTGSLATGRANSTATRLADGRVLVAGGYVLVPDGNMEKEVPLSTVEIYDPATGTFSPAAGMTTPRGLASASLLPDGRVLIAGGTQYGPSSWVGLPTAEIYDPVTGVFSLPEAMGVELADHSATLLPTGDILFAGSERCLYHPAPGQVGPAGPSLAADRAFHTATLLSSGDVLLTGGPFSKTAEVFRSKTSQFVSAGGTMKVTRGHHTATALVNGRVLIAGGTSSNGSHQASAELYDPAAAQFLPVADMLEARTHHTATLLPDGRVLVTGGGNTSTEALASAEIYDPETKLFAATGPMAEARLDHTATLLPDGKVLVTGGLAEIAGGLVLASAELFDPKSGQFTEAGSMSAERFAHAAIVLFEGKVLVIGGDEEPATAELFDPATGTFEFAALMAKPRYYHQATLLPTRDVLVSGGFTPLPGDKVDPLEEVEIFNPRTGLFSVEGALIKGRFGHTATLLPNGDVLAAGGYESKDPIEVTVSSELWRSTPPADEAWRPVVEALPAPAAIPGQPMEVQGSGFLGVSSASGDGSRSSPTNHPIALWMPVEGAPQLGTLAPWSATSATWWVPATPYAGPGLLFVVVNGIRSAGAPVIVGHAAQGIPCGNAAGACATGHCVDGVCCDSACDAECEACSAAKKQSGADGECGPIAAATDPDSECPGLAPETCGSTGTCDGAGHCTLHPNGTPCTGELSCYDGVCGAEACDRDHHVVSGDGSRDCAPFRCSTVLDDCLLACTSHLDCIEGLACTAEGLCEAIPEDGADLGCGACEVGARRSAPPWGAAGLILACILLAVRRRRGAAGGAGAL